jgi:RNA polymerase sigma-70 factor (ECF subfamily)
MALPGASPLSRPDAERRARFRELYEREFDYVWASLRRLGVRPGEVEDVAQDLFVLVHHRLDDYDRSRPIRPWLFAFAVRCASDWRRLARNRHAAPGPWVEPQATWPIADELLERARDRALVLQALDGIDIDRRAVFILHELDGCSMRVIAEALGIPLFTGYSRLRIAREEFTAAVRRLRREEGNR